MPASLLRVVCLLCFGLLTVSGRGAPAARPNVVFIVIDNVDFSYLGKCYGGTGLTPAIDRLAEQGVKFTRAYATTPLCVPSRYSCLTGRYATRGLLRTDDPQGVDEDEASSVPLEADVPNLPKVMQAAGYATGLVGKYHLEEEKYPRFAGKDGSVFNPEAAAWLKQRSTWLTEHIKARGFDEVYVPIDFRKAQFSGIDFEGAEQNQEAEIDGALKFIEAKKGQPFFLYLSTHLLHLPIDPKLLLKDPEKYSRVTESGLAPEAPKVPMPSRAEIYREAEKAGARTSLQFGIHWLDCGLSAVLQRLEDLKLAENTLVILFSDNNQRGKETLYEGGARVPLIMKWPGHFASGTVSHRIVANIDFAPTILDAAGLRPPAEMKVDGRSMLPILSDPNAAWRDGLLLENGHTRAVVTDQWKYVALRYAPEIQARIDEVDRTGVQPRLTKKAEQFFEKFKKTLTPEQWNFARNSYRWHTPGNNYMKSIDDFPFQFEPDQLFAMSEGLAPQDSENVAGKPENAAVLGEMKAKLKAVMAPLGQRFGEFGVPGPAPVRELPARKRRNAK